MNGTVVVGEGDIERCQDVWQVLGGMEVGSLWGMQLDRSGLNDGLAASRSDVRNE